MCNKESDKTISVKITQPNSKKKTNAVREPIIYLNLPGDYSGDVWHAAAAMIVNCNVHVVITRQSDSPNSKDVKTTNRAKAFFEACGIPKNRVHDTFTGEVYIDPLDLNSKDDRVRDIATAAAHRKAAEAQVQKLKLPKGDVHAVYSSTYIWMSAVKQDPQALAAIRAAFVHGFEKRKPKEAAKIREVVASLSAPLQTTPTEKDKIEIIEDEISQKSATKDKSEIIEDEISQKSTGKGKIEIVEKEISRKSTANDKIEDEIKKPAPARVPFLLVNMRMSNYHSEDNTSEWMYQEIAEFCQKAKIRLVRVGAWNKYDKTHNSIEGIWMKGLPTDVVDIYSYCILDSKLADLQSVAYFWALCALQPECRGVLGGRSGSSDVAGFSGFAPGRLLCWTERREKDPGYQRQHLMAGRFMSLIDINADKQVPKESEHNRYHNKAKLSDLEDFQIVKFEMKGFTSLQYGIFLSFGKEPMTFAPVGYKGFEPEPDELHALVKSPGCVMFCGSEKFEIQISPIPQNVVRHTINSRFREGHSDYKGNNCLIHSLYQIQFGEGKGSEKEIEEIRLRMLEVCPKIESGTMLDVYDPDEGGLLMEVFPGLRIQVIQLHWTAMILEGPILGKGEGPIQYILHQGNHFVPLWSL